MDLWKVLNHNKVLMMEFREDNAGACTVIKTGETDELQHAERMQDVCCIWLHDAFQKLNNLKLPGSGIVVPSVPQNLN